MICPKLSDLPTPPQGRSGWPWTRDSHLCDGAAVKNREWPSISIVTPSFNQGRFIEATIRSVLLQGYPKLEYFILDGGSTDESVEIIKKYSPWLTHWVSEPDSGQSEAINRGLRWATGAFATWINSDDLLCQNALLRQAAQIDSVRNTIYVGNCHYLDEEGNIVSSHRGRVHSLEDLVRVRTVWRSGGHIVQPEVLFPRELALLVGSLNPDNHRTMDYELWGKFLLAGAGFRYTDVNFGMFRQHSAQKTHNDLKQTQSLLDAARKLIVSSESFSEELKSDLLADLESYSKAYPIESWKATGRLATCGLPRGIVMPLRSLLAMLQRFAAEL